MTPTIPESHLDLLNAPTAVLATIGEDGRPQLSAVWFLAEGETIKLSINTSRQKVKNLQARPAVDFFILDPARDSRYLEVRGDAELADDPGYAFAEQVGKKYGADLRAFDGDHQERVVVTIRPTRVNAADMESRG
jgi:PPOX class probable F420-dependent enzyme